MFKNITIIKSIAKAFNSTVAKAAFGISLFSFSFGANAQIISIGSAVSAVEGSSNISFVISIDGGGVNTSGSAITGTISYSGSATEGADYTGAPTFSIPVGANSTTVTIFVIDDAFVEPTETVSATISGLNIGNVGNNDTSSAFIFDDDSGAIFISIGSPVDAVEGSSDITFEVFMEGGVVNSSGSPITGTIAYGGSGTSSTDFIPVTSFSIPNGANSTLITITVINDLLIESTETVIATLTGNPNFGSYANTSSTAFILDDDASNLIVSIGSPVDGTEGGTVSFTVFLENGLINGTGTSIFGSLNYSGTAVNASDYAGPTTFAILNGQNSTVLSLSVLDDILVECTETIIATISNPSIGAVGAASSTADIIDDECSQVSISISSPVDGAEGSTDISYVVSLDGGFINATGASITGFVNLAGTATIGTDCSDVVSFDIPDGASFETLVIAVIDDITIEPTESVIATISSPSIGVISASSVETAYIFDNDSTTSINEIDFSDINLSVYPNPTKGTFVIEADEQILGVEMCDLQGRTVQSWKTSAKKVNVNITGSAEGYYICTVMLNDGRFVTRKVLKE